MNATCTRLIAPGLIDSWLKLQLLLLFQRHPHLRGEARHLTDWFHESPWAVAEALDGLVEAAFLDRVEQHTCILYHLEISAENRMRLDCLALEYEDPFRRDEMYALVRAADGERQFRSCANEVVGYVIEIVW